MKTYKLTLVLNSLWLALALFPSSHALAQSSADPGWPRVFKKSGKEVTVYQPQVDYWNGYTNIHYRAAIAVKGVSKQEQFGVAEVDALTVVDQGARVVALVPLTRNFRFPNTTDSEAAALRKAVEEVMPPGQATTISLDRVLAYLNPEEQPVQRPVDVNIQPPKIYYSRKPAILVMFMGEPELKPADTNRTDLMFALNTNWDVFYDTTEGRYYLLNGASWLTTADAVNGPWTPAKKLPAALSALPATENWDDVRKNLPGKAVKEAPVVFVTTEPAEMILTKGEPSFSPIPGTRLMRVANTESALFLHSGEGQYYLLAAGRWFRTKTLDGPWSAASADLPADFQNIPDSNVAAFVKTSVPGTRDAKDAVLLASVPTTTSVAINTPVTTQVIYTGAPQYVVIEGTTVQYAVNTPNQVFLVSGGYYWCNQGAWFCGASANGPWMYCTTVPSAIYTIPPSNPNYNVTYVVVQSSTPTTVVYSQTSGYSGEYVAANGVLMFGMGIAVGAIIANNHDHYYYPPPCHYSYGCGAVYHHGYGGYAASAHVSYGPYGGAGRTAAYNPHTGTYSRGAYAYGPAGSRSVQQAYNPYTGGYAQRANVNTAHGSAGRFYADNGNGEQAWGGYRSGAQGTVAGARTSEGAGAVAWDTRYSQGVVAKDKSGNVYAGKDGTVYKKDSSGGWSSNSGSGWNSVSSPQPRATTTSATSSSRATPTTRAQSTWSQPSASSQARQPSSSSSWGGSSRDSVQSLDSQAQSRSWGNKQASSASASRSSAGTSSRSGGGRSRR